MKEQVKKILSALGSKRLPKHINEISIVFTNDSEIRRLNSTYRGKDKATDILSFSQLEGKKGPVPSPLLGDLVISLDTAKRQAKEAGVKVRDEISRLLIHGILHLFGYDHEKVSHAKAQAMRRKEKKLFREITGP